MNHFPWLGVFVAGLFAGSVFAFKAFEWIEANFENFCLLLVGKRQAKRQTTLSWRLRQFLPLRKQTLWLVAVQSCFNPMILGVFFDGPGMLLCLPYAFFVSTFFIMAGRLTDATLFSRLQVLTAQYAAARAARMLPVSDLEAAFQELGRSNVEAIQNIAAKYYIRFGLADALDRLNVLRKDTSPKLVEASELAMKDRHSWIIERVLKSLSTLDPLLLDYQLALRPSLGKDGLGYQMDVRKLAAKEDAIDLYLISQFPLKQAYPHVFCTRCYARPEICHAHGWWWLRCRHCKEAMHLLPGVEEVVGRIGPLAEEVFVDGKYYVNLWDEAKKAGIPAEIDSLEVLGGAQIQYDWALSKVVSMIEQGRGLSKPLPIRLLGNPVLEPNSIALLRRFKGKLTES